jgi:3'(2'), 5'-bisphosphate nucleotidase
MTELLKLAIKAALKAGAEIMEVYATEDFSIEFKKDDSPLTKADKLSHEVICSFLSATTIPILSEEGRSIPYEERSAWNQLWIVDPIDGTKEFIKRNGEFTVNIALIENQVPILGVIFVPALNELYFASKENGTFKVSADVNSNIDELLQTAYKLPLESTRSIYTVVASRSHLSPETEAFINDLKQEHGEVDSISKGSSLKLCMVAEGAADCYPRFAPTMEWDTAAGHAICKYAGFLVQDFQTKAEMVYNREDLLNNWFLVR